MARPRAWCWRSPSICVPGGGPSPPRGCRDVSTRRRRRRVPSAPPPVSASGVGRGQAPTQAGVTVWHIRDRSRPRADVFLSGHPVGQAGACNPDGQIHRSTPQRPSSEYRVSRDHRIVSVVSHPDKHRTTLTDRIRSPIQRSTVAGSDSRGRPPPERRCAAAGGHVVMEATRGSTGSVADDPHVPGTRDGGRSPNSARRHPGHDLRGAGRMRLARLRSTAYPGRAAGMVHVTTS